jgi:hypothetical protein
VTPLDCGQAVTASGRCELCRLDDRPLWSDGAVVACATCVVRRHPDRDVSFLSGDRATTARQMALL